MNYLLSKLKAIARMFFVKQLSDEDVSFIEEHLGKSEQILFYRMSIVDQIHSLHVAYTLKEMLNRKSRINLKKMLKVALLHDIGKADIKLTLNSRLYQTSFFFFCKPFANYLANKGKEPNASRRKKLLYYYKEHGNVGAALLREINVDENIAYLVESHHNEPSINEPIELSLLREADDVN